jgi:hypothetical protein
MNAQLLQQHKKVFNLFSVMRNLEELEYTDSISDDGYPKVCHFCDGFKDYRYDKSLEGHKDDCLLMRNKGNLFKLIIDECSNMEDGNSFLNLTTEMYFKNVI